MAKPKKLSFKIIDRDLEPEPYDLMDEIREAYHGHLEEARIALAWCFSWKPDPEGHLVLGKCKKASDLDRQLHNFDFVILLNHDVWELPAFTDKKKRGLMDHELCHADMQVDGDGEPVLTADDRNVWRIRKHDIEEFQCIVERHGCYKKDIEEFARAALKRSRAPLFEADEEEAIPDGTGVAAAPAN